MTTSSKPFLSYYGDDFTGSTDVMEALATHGVATVLFLTVPGPELLKRFSHCRAIGLAGTSRSESPAWMDANLVSIFTWLKSLEAEFCHYKVCSTFDSSPSVGNIGRAIEIGKSVFAQSHVPLIVGAPQLKRYTAFGHLFAGYQGQTYRIDRHPVMGRHPVTPMDEADLKVHLAKQTTLDTGLVDLAMLQAGSADAIDRVIAGAPGIVLFDVDSADSQRRAGEQVFRLKGPGGWFVAGSSGVEYALLTQLETTAQTFTSPGPVERMAVVSGSVSPTTERQIQHAGQHGFELLAVSPLNLIGENRSTVMDATVATAVEALKAGRSPLIYTALGPSQDLGKALDRHGDARHRTSQALGKILRRLVELQGLKRVVIAGGDTSSHALRELDIEALTTLMPLPATPGSPLCLAHGSTPATDGLQLALKGGQIGGDDYFSLIRRGG